MYDALTATYRLACPAHGATRVRLSSFRTLDRLPGASHPAVFRVTFDCGCGGQHATLVTHDELDWAPLGLEAGTFLNLMTARLDDAGAELGELAARRIGAGEWPWSFFCYLEERPRPVYPSSFVVLAPGGRAVALAVRCPVCASLSVNLVSAEHVNVPFCNDTAVGVVQHVFQDDASRTLDEFRSELYSADFDERRLRLD
jgi:hypothetical protein